MKILMIAVLMLAGSWASARTINPTGKIHFQKDSTWVGHYSRSLCFDGTHFHALVTKCVKWGGRGGDECIRTARKQAVPQPQNSTRTICRQGRNRRDERCAPEPYFQSENLTIREYDDRGNRETNRFIWTVPAC